MFSWVEVVFARVLTLTNGKPISMAINALFGFIIKKLSIPTRQKITHELQEIEAESVAYIVCERNDVRSKSHTYLSNYVDEDTTLEDIDVYQIMRAAGQVETLLKLATRTKFT